jgi:hypothetical protein
MLFGLSLDDSTWHRLRIRRAFAPAAGARDGAALRGGIRAGAGSLATVTGCGPSSIGHRAFSFCRA